MPCLERRPGADAVTLLAESDQAALPGLEWLAAAGERGFGTAARTGCRRRPAPPRAAKSRPVASLRLVAMPAISSCSARVEVDVDADADQGDDLVAAGAPISIKDAGDLLAVDKHVVRPLQSARTSRRRASVTASMARPRRAASLGKGP